MVSIDSQLMKTSKQRLEVGFDGEQHVNGLTHHLLVDTRRLMVAVVVTADNPEDRVGLVQWMEA